MIEIYTKNKKLNSKIDKKSLVNCFENLSCAAVETLINEAAMQAELANRDEIIIEDIVQAGKKTNLVNIKIK